MLEKIKLFFRGVWGAIKSWTIWFNSAAAPVFMYWEDIKSTVPDLAAHMTPENYKRLALAVVIINLLLRIKTKKALTER